MIKIIFNCAERGFDCGLGAACFISKGVGYSFERVGVHIAEWLGIPPELVCFCRPFIEAGTVIAIVPTIAVTGVILGMSHGMISGAGRSISSAHFDS